MTTPAFRPSEFIEYEGCDGPKFIRSQPSREETGITMTEIQNKYIPEFELPFRNIQRYIKEMKNNWDRLDPNQRKAAQNSLKDMGMVEGFGNVEMNCKCTGNKICKCKEMFTNGCGCSGSCGKEGFGTDAPTSAPTTNAPSIMPTSAPINPNLITFLGYLSADTTNNPKSFLNILFKPTDSQKTQLATNGITSSNLRSIKDSIYQWSVDNTYALHANWQSGLILGFFLLIVIILIIVAATRGE